MLFTSRIVVDIPNTENRRHRERYTKFFCEKYHVYLLHYIIGVDVGKEVIRKENGLLKMQGVVRSALARHFVKNSALCLYKKVANFATRNYRCIRR